MTCLICTVDTTAADAIRNQGALVSATIVLTELSRNIPGSLPEALRNNIHQSLTATSPTKLWNNVSREVWIHG